MARPDETQSQRSARPVSARARWYVSGKLLYGQGRPMAKSASGDGADFADGLTSENTGGTVTVESRLFFDGTVASSSSANDLSRATDAREKGRIGIFGSALAYAGSYGRVTSESVGRDLNPLGRGDGNAYVAGGMSLGRISPTLPWNNSPGGWGNSVNNGCGRSTPQVESTEEDEHTSWDCSDRCSCDSHNCGYPLKKNPCCGKGYTKEDGTRFCDCVSCLWHNETRWCETGKYPPTEEPELKAERNCCKLTGEEIHTDTVSCMCIVYTAGSGSGNATPASLDIIMRYPTWTSVSCTDPDAIPEGFLIGYVTFEYQVRSNAALGSCPGKHWTNNYLKHPIVCGDEDRIEFYTFKQDALYELCSGYRYVLNGAEMSGCLCPIDPVSEGRAPGPRA